MTQNFEACASSPIRSCRPLGIGRCSGIVPCSHSRRLALESGPRFVLPFTGFLPFPLSWLQSCCCMCRATFDRAGLCSRRYGEKIRIHCHAFSNSSRQLLDLGADVLEKSLAAPSSYQLSRLRRHAREEHRSRCARPDRVSAQSVHRKPQSGFSVQKGCGSDMVLDVARRDQCSFAMVVENDKVHRPIANSFPLMALDVVIRHSCHETR